MRELSKKLSFVFIKKFSNAMLYVVPEFGQWDWFAWLPRNRKGRICLLTGFDLIVLDWMSDFFF